MMLATSIQHNLRISDQAAKSRHCFPPSRFVNLNNCSTLSQTLAAAVAMIFNKIYHSNDSTGERQMS
jgi:hypothetical protein